MNSVKWGEYRIGDLFDISPTRYYKSVTKCNISDINATPIISNTTLNNGIIGFSELEPINEGGFITCSDTTLGAETMFYQAKSYIGYQHVQAFKPKGFLLNQKIAHFLISACRKSTCIGYYSYGNKFNRNSMRNTIISLPQTENGEIDFAFMEDFVAELEAQHVAELEAYLTATGLNDYILTEEEQNAIDSFDKVKWGKYKNTDCFDIQPIKRMLSKKDLILSGVYPVYSSQSINGGIIGYTNSPDYICDENNPIYVTFGDHTRTFHLAKKSFSIMDNVKVLKPNLDNEKVLLFLISSWGKNIHNLGYSRHWKIAKDSCLLLPQTTDGKINFDFMETFISAIQKLVIKGVVEYKDELISTTKSVIE